MQQYLAVTLQYRFNFLQLDPNVIIEFQFEFILNMYDKI